MFNDVQSDAQSWHNVDGEDNEAAVCSRLINLTLNLECGWRDVDPGALPPLWELTHMWLLVCNRAMERQRVDFMWSNEGDVWCQFSLGFLPLLSYLGVCLGAAPSSGSLRADCCSAISVKFSIWGENMSGLNQELRGLLLSQARVYTNRPYVTQPGPGLLLTMQHVGRTDTAGCAFISRDSPSAFLSCVNVSAVREAITVLNSADTVQCLCGDTSPRTHESSRVHYAQNKLARTHLHTWEKV